MIGNFCECFTVFAHVQEYLADGPMARTCGLHLASSSEFKSAHNARCWFMLIQSIIAINSANIRKDTAVSVGLQQQPILPSY